MSQKYNGTITALKNGVKLAGIAGKWQADGSGKYTFRSVTGGILNWWETSKTIQFQGNINGRDDLELSLEDLLSGKIISKKPTRIAVDDGLVPFAKAKPHKHKRPSGGKSTTEPLLERVNKALTEYGLTVMMRDDMLCVVNESEFDFGHYS